MIPGFGPKVLPELRCIVQENQARLHTVTDAQKANACRAIVPIGAAVDLMPAPKTPAQAEPFGVPMAKWPAVPRKMGQAVHYAAQLLTFWPTSQQAALGWIVQKVPKEATWKQLCSADRKTREIGLRQYDLSLTYTITLELVSNCIRFRGCTMADFKALRAICRNMFGKHADAKSALRECRIIMARTHPDRVANLGYAPQSRNAVLCARIFETVSKLKLLLQDPVYEKMVFNADVDEYGGWLRPDRVVGGILFGAVVGICISPLPGLLTFALVLAPVAYEIWSAGKDIDELKSFRHSREASEVVWPAPDCS